MFFKKIFSEGLAHNSYIIGDGNCVAVIDPRRDVQIYIDIAMKYNKRITHIFETHRNEDIISGSMELAEYTGAKIYISKYEEIGHIYGKRIGESDEFILGNLKIKPIHTPGHTKGHLSYLILQNLENPYAIFTGDSLFYGDIGRTDFYGEENLEKMTGLMYDSIYNKLFKLDDSVLVYPAHGSGSACGGSIEEREVSTIGYEKKYNESAKANSRDEFIKKNGYLRLKPYYFTYIEQANIKGAEFLGDTVNLNSVNISDINLSCKDIVIDIRTREAHTGKHIPGSVGLNLKILSNYMGWIYCQNETIYLLADGLSSEEVEKAYWMLRRMGYDYIDGVLGNDTIHKMEIENQCISRLKYVSAGNYLKIAEEESENIVTLDVRKVEELEEDDRLINRVNIPVQLLSMNTARVPRDKEIYIVCASGIRATLAASILESVGIEGTLVNGGMKAINNLREK